MSLSMARASGLNPHLLEIMDPNDSGNYYTDLELAAAIGKNLLERNKELELLLYSTQDYAEEQVKKSEHLSRQLNDAREMNDNRVTLMEQIESNSEELFRSHTKLKKETRSIQEHNEILAESLQSLVEKCEHYKTEMKNLKMANAQLQRQLSTTEIAIEPKKPEYQPIDNERVIVEKEVQKLSVAIEKLKTEQYQEKTTREVLESDLSELILQNQNLEQKLRMFAKGSNDSYTEECAKDFYKEEFEELDEEDGYMNESFVVVESPDIEEIDSDLSPSLEHCDISFLDELDLQYRDLVNKYNSLLEKCKSEGIPYESRELCMVQRGVQTSEVGVDVIEVGEGVIEVSKSLEEEGMPEYKKMFAMIYEKIRESTN